MSEVPLYGVRRARGGLRFEAFEIGVYFLGFGVEGSGPAQAGDAITP